MTDIKSKYIFVRYFLNFNNLTTKSHVILNYNLADISDILSSLYNLCLSAFVLQHMLHFLMTFLTSFLIYRK